MEYRLGIPVEMKVSKNIKCKLIFSVVLMTALLFPQFLQAQFFTFIDSLEAQMKIRQGQSWVAQMIENSMRSSKVKEGNRLADYMNYLNKITPARPLNSLYLLYDIDVDDSLGHNVWTIEPVKDMSEKVIIYLHGGSYMYNFMSPHWMFISYIIDQLKAKVIAPDYPLAPEYNVTHVFDMLLKLYTELIKNHDPKHISIIGDSAGGGMSLALGQLFAEKGLPQPEQLILLSPCVDLTLTNPDIVEVDKDDPLLNIESILIAGELYAGPLDRKNYLVSPIYGELKGLAPISLYVGTHDLLVADCRKLNMMAIEQGIPFTYHEYEGLFHVGMLYPTPEGEEIRKEIIEDLSE
ncbi:MAG: alpha/beta hydrolase fold domain-containing protein [Candidatus Marinimicrobia bacterium]|nr:alpha/beta hydrolase fold domain-containing protein [Candidatus Neomarinimicrobiota bacterium]